MNFLLSPFGTRLVAAALVLAGLVAVFWKVRDDGRRDALAAVERANRVIENQADQAEQNVLTCPPELWNREQQRCSARPAQ